MGLQSLKNGDGALASGAETPDDVVDDGEIDARPRSGLVLFPPFVKGV